MPFETGPVQRISDLALFGCTHFAARRFQGYLESLPTLSKSENSCTARKLVGLRMSSAQAWQLARYDASDNRSAAQFALMMYLRGLQAWESECEAAKPTRRGDAR